MNAWTRPPRRTSADPGTEVERELSFHLEMRVRELIEQGMPEAEAREAASRRFGSYDASRRECVEIDGRRKERMRRTQYLTELFQDLATRCGCTAGARASPPWPW